MKINQLEQVKAGESFPGCHWLDPAKAPFRLYGIMAPDSGHDYYHRIPQRVADTVNDGVAFLNHHTAGGRIRFVTDSPFVAITTKQSCIEPRGSMTMTGRGGFDLYAEAAPGDDRYMGSFIPGVQEYDGFTRLLPFWEGSKRRIITINMPLYGGVNSIYIGLDEGCEIEPAPDYETELPIVYYGSSITQGGDASRPGNSYQAILTRQLRWNHINLGFSGSARGEETIRDYMTELDMKVFVLDYDHNAPDPEHLRKTHMPLYRAIRKAKPTVPIVMLTRPKLYLEPHEAERLAIVKATYETAAAEGDRNVYFIPGTEFFDRFSGDSATVDNCHPNDFGFMCMAERLYPLLKQLR